MSLELLTNELDVYSKQKNELIGKSKGKFVLIKDNEVVDVFDSAILLSLLDDRL